MSSITADVVLSNDATEEIYWTARVDPNLSVGLAIDPSTGILTDSAIVQLWLDRDRFEVGGYEGSVFFETAKGEKKSLAVSFIVLRPEYSSLRGICFFSGTRVPIEGVEVSIGDSKTTSSTDGFFEFPEVRAGQILVRAAKPDFDPYSALLLLPTEGLTLQIDMKSAIRSASVSGRVLRKNQHELEGAAVTVLNPDGGASNLSASSDETGSYRVDSVPQGIRTLRFEKAGYVEQEVELAVSKPEIQYDAILASGVPPACGEIILEGGLIKFVDPPHPSRAGYVVDSTECLGGTMEKTRSPLVTDETYPAPQMGRVEVHPVDLDGNVSESSCEKTGLFVSEFTLPFKDGGECDSQNSTVLLAWVSPSGTNSASTWGKYVCPMCPLDPYSGQSVFSLVYSLGVVTLSSRNPFVIPAEGASLSFARTGGIRVEVSAENVDWVHLPLVPSLTEKPPWEWVSADLKPWAEKKIWLRFQSDPPDASGPYLDEITIR